MPTQRDERRHTPRYPADTRLFASIDGQTVILYNISRSGVALYARGLEAGGTHVRELNLNHHHMTLAIEILDSSGDRLLHARFVEPGQQVTTLIDEYITGL